MSLQIDDLDQIDGRSTQTSNDDIFSNPLEAFPEFIDEPVRSDGQTVAPEEEPAPKTAEVAVEMPVSEPASDNEKKETPAKVKITSSTAYVDPLDQIEEIDLSALSQGSSTFSFDDDSDASVKEEQADSFFTKTNLTLGTLEYEDVAVRKTESYSDYTDAVPEETTETEEVSLDDFLSPSGNQMEEIDLDSFLSDDTPANSGSSNTTEEISLDDFGVDFSGIDADAGIDVSAIDAFAASMRQEKAEKSDIENAPAIEMELVFDDEFVLETKANPEDDIDFDFEALMAGESIPVPQQATGDELLDNFDDIFNNIVDEGSPAPSASEVSFDPNAIEEVSLDDFGIGGASADSGEKVTEQQIVFDEVNEFDDLLSSFSDETHVEVAEKQTNRQNASGPQDYNIIVIMDEDDDTTVAAPAPRIEESEEEDYEVSIFSSEEDAEQYRNKSKPFDYQDEGASFAPSGSSESFVSVSDSFEDISLDDFGVSFEDVTPAATKETAQETASATSESSITEESDEQAETTETAIPEDLDESSETAETDAPTLEDETVFRIEEPAVIPEGYDIPEDEPEYASAAHPDMPEEPQFVPEIPEQQEISFEEQYGEVPTVENIINEAGSESEEMISDSSEPTDETSGTPVECEDTTFDEKIIVDKSEISVYNGDNTEDTSNMIDGNNEEITDTMNSMNEGLLEKIVSELSVLRNEMQNLRDEMQTLKNGAEPSFDEAVSQDEAVVPEEPAVTEAASEEIITEEAVVSEEPAVVEEPAVDIPLPEADPFAAPQDAGGFFSGDDDDETIALSGDELNNILNSADFTQEDGSNFGMEAPEGSILPDDIAGDFAMEAPAEEAAPASDDLDINFDEPAPEAPAEEESAPAADDFDINFDEPAPEAPAEEESAPAAADDLDINFDEPAPEVPSEEEAAQPEMEDASIDDFNTDLPSIKEDAVEAPADDFSIDETPSEEAAPAAEESEPSDSFSLDEFDIPEPSVDESSIADIDIDEPDADEKAENTADSFSLDEFDIPEPSVEENSIADIDIDEPSVDIPSDEPATPSAEDSDFYENSDSPAIAEKDISTVDIQDNLEEPVLDDIDFGMDEPEAEDIEIPTAENLIVDSSSTDFLEEDDPTIDEQLTSEKVDYLNEDATADDLASLPDINDIPDAVEDTPAVEGMEDSLEADTFATSEDETPADDMFSSQWDAEPAETPAPSFDDEFGEETVAAATSFDDPVGFDIEDIPDTAETPAEEISEEAVPEEPETAPADQFDAIADYEAPASEPEAAPTEALSGDLKQEVKSVLKYMDQLLENLPEDKIAEFAQSEHFDTYKKLFNELGLV